MKFTEWQKLGKEEKIKQISTTIEIGSDTNFIADCINELFTTLKETPQIPALDLTIEGSIPRQQAAFKALAKHLAQDQHVSQLSIRSTFIKGDFFFR